MAPSPVTLQAVPKLSCKAKMATSRATPAGSNCQNAHHDAQGGHDRAAGNTGRADGENAEQHDEQCHGPEGRHVPVEHQGDGHGEEGLGEHGSAKVDRRPQRNHESTVSLLNTLEREAHSRETGRVAALDMVPTAVR